MNISIPLALILGVTTIGSAVAQTQPAQTVPSPATPQVSPTAPTTATGTTDPSSLTLTDAQANAWVNKTVYSSDARNLGEVAAVQRDASGKVSEIHADIGGFLGLGETRVRIMPTQFKIENDRIVLNMTSEQAKTLPHIAK